MISNMIKIQNLNASLVRIICRRIPASLLFAVPYQIVIPHISIVSWKVLMIEKITSY